MSSPGGGAPAPEGGREHDHGGPRGEGRFPHILNVFDNRVPSAQADTEQLVNNLAALSRAGADSTLLIPSFSGAATAREIRSFYDVDGSFDVDRYWSPSWSRAAQKLWAGFRTPLMARSDDPTVLYTRHLPVAVGAAARRVPVVHETYRPWPRQYPVLRPALRRLARSTSFLGAVLHSHVAGRSYVDSGIDPEKILVAHNGFEPHRLEPVLERGEARGLLDLPARRHIVVYTGRLSAEKGLDVVLEMARLLPDVLFLLVGAGEDDSFRREAQSVSNVELVPWQPYDRVARHLYAADVLLLPPSRGPMERHGNTVLPLKLFSYLPSGRAILGPDREDIREILRDGENACLVRPDDPAAAARTLRRLLDDPGLRHRLAEGARRTAGDLTWDDRARRILDFVTDRMRRRSGRA